MVGRDFINYANRICEISDQFIVGLSHGKSPSGAYEYILNHYDELKYPEKITYTCINSKLERQRGLSHTRDALSLLKALLERNLISKDQIIGRSLDRKNIDKYCDGLNKWMQEYLLENNKEGLDFLFIATDTNGLTAGITRNSEAFKSNEISVVVSDTEDKELTFTPYFLKKSRKISFLATKADKRRPLAWLYYRWAKDNESPSFLRFIDNVNERMTVYIDDNALTWPQVVLNRKTGYGDTTIRIDLAKPYDTYGKKKLPVVLFIHGFLGLNSFDALLAFIPSHKYIAAAFHYGSIPYDLPPEEFSQFVVENINEAVKHFGELGHDVYIFDHSMANVYMLMIERQFENLHGINKYLKGRISANPFFGSEVKHTTINFIDHVILKSKIGLSDRAAFISIRKTLPFYRRNAVRRNSIGLSSILIKKDSGITNRIWDAIKQRILFILSDIDTLPELNRVPIEHTLNRLPAKIFVIQIQSALRASKKNEHLRKLKNFEQNNIPVLVLKSDRDPVAKYVKHPYADSSNVDVLDTTNWDEKDLFKEHLYYLIRPKSTINIIEQFIKNNK